MDNSLIVVISAGGRASRLGGGSPKSLMMVGEITYLEATLNEIRELTTSEILIYCDRTEYLSDIMKVITKYTGTTLINDCGAQSTYAIASHASNYSHSCRVLFLYGHSPKSSVHLKKMIQAETGVSVSLYHASSKRKPINIKGRGYIEPPYIIRTDLINKHPQINTWEDFFMWHRKILNCVTTNAPCEFNSPKEKLIFDTHFFSWYKNRPTRCSIRLLPGCPS